jgi:hypothetical protein
MSHTTYRYLTVYSTLHKLHTVSATLRYLETHAKIHPCRGLYFHLLKGSPLNSMHTNERAHQMYGSQC